MDDSQKSLYRHTREQITKHRLILKKSLGQNFLVDAHALSKIIAAVAIEPDDIVIEVGAGIGTLTKELAKLAKTVYTWEVDARMIPALAENIAGCDNVVTLQEDFLKADLQAVIGALPESGTVKVCANLPYYISSPIIMKLLESGIKIDRMVVMVQKEVGDRMRAQPDTKEYSSFTAALSYYAKVTQVANVPVNCFIPRPQVNSCVMLLSMYPEPPEAVEDTDLLFTIIRAAFSMRRKTLLNCLASQEEFELSKDDCVGWMALAGIPANVRGESLPLSAFAALANTYKQVAKNE